MSDSVHLLVPFAHAAADGCAQALRGLRLPHFERLLARLAVESTDAGDPHSLSTPHERALARAHALPPVEGLIPFAALQAAQAGAADAADEGWAWVSPLSRLALPLLAFVMALAAVLVVAERGVVRWLGYLQRVAAIYARGRFTVRPIQAEHAPPEIRDLGETLDIMARTIVARDASLRVPSRRASRETEPG